MKIFTFLAFSLLSASVLGQTITPQSYVVAKASTPVVMDGDIYSAEWQKAPWTENFVDIRGYDYKPTPKFGTRAKMLYDDKYLYIAIEMIEPHIWGTLTERDATIYYDNDIEVFIDPDGNSKNYMEFEFNALNTQWDLLLTEPQRLGGVHINNFDLKGLITVVKLYGTINDPSDTDEKWTIEIAMPIDGLQQPSYNKRVPLTKQTWRVNLSRVEWLKYEVADGQYRKIKGTGTFGNEENWVWSPTGVVDMHRPELWGKVTFAP